MLQGMSRNSKVEKGNGVEDRKLSQWGLNACDEYLHLCGRMQALASHCLQLHSCKRSMSIRIRLAAQELVTESNAI